VDLTVGELIEQMEKKAPDTALSRKPVFRGGPVDVDRGFVLHPSGSEWEATMPVTDNIFLTTSNDIITAMAEGRGPEKSLVALGFAGWGAGQLEEEIRDNAWLNCPANSQLLFETEIANRWEAAAGLLGIDINQLTGDVGHA
jgi:putative transcriptional regulator